MSNKFKMTFAFVVLAALGLAGCGSGEAAPAYETVAPASISPGDVIPVPSGEVILTLSGEIAAQNAGDTLVFDMSTLEQLGLVQYTVHDPHIKTDVTYTGVLMSDLLKVAGIPPSATTVHLVALDDYQVEINIVDVQKWPVLLATQADGNYMAIEDGGPTRIVFPYDTYPNIDPVSYNALWIWSIKSMELK